MTFTSVHSVLPAVGDLRLIHQTQSGLREALTKHFPTTTTPIDITIIILRQIYAQVLRFPLRFQSTTPGNIRSREETCCALLRFLWADLSRETTAAQSFLKHATIQQLQPRQVTAGELLNSALLQTTLWQRPEFRLYDTTCVVRAPASTQWKHAPCDLQLYQLLAFDGKGDTGQLLSRKWTSTAVRPDNKYQVQHLFGRPVVMIMSYRAVAKKTFDEMKRIVFVAQYMHRPRDNSLPSVRQDTMDYRLIAVVRCAQGETKDSVRLYSQAGHMTWKDKEEWEMGDTPGALYLLYYGLALAEIDDRILELHAQIERESRMRKVQAEVKPIGKVKRDEAVSETKNAQKTDQDVEADQDAKADAEGKLEPKSEPEQESAGHSGRVTRSTTNKRRRVSYKEE